MGTSQEKAGGNPRIQRVKIYLSDWYPFQREKHFISTPILFFSYHFLKLIFNTNGSEPLMHLLKWPI